MSKKFRRSINIEGEQVKSPRFDRASDADRWYQQKKREKQLAEEGISLPVDKSVILSDYFDRKWIIDRRKTYPQSTTDSDEQRFNDYVRKPLGNKPVARISQLHIRKTLKGVTDKGRSIQTRNRVRALLSKLFNDAMNEDPPLKADNPAINISFNDPRQGKASPEYIKREKDIKFFLAKAKELSSTHYAYASIALMAGLRKSEIIPLQWSDFDEGESEIFVGKRFMQASNEIVRGTKGGTEETRALQIPDSLVRILNAHRRQSDYQADSDFILNISGKNLSPRQLHDLHCEICEASEISVTPHGLRHTFGREWVRRGGSMKGLQTQMGHSNSSVTDLYSQLAGKAVKKERNTVDFEVEDDE